MSTATAEKVENLPARAPALVAGGAVRAIVPQDMDQAWRLAVAVHASGIVPYGIDSREKAMIAILHGLEIGLTPMNAMQSIAVINGKPTIYGDAAIGLVRASGLLESIKETIEGEGDAMTARCIVKRKGEVEPITGDFSVADAKLSGLWTKTGRNGAPTPWQLYPKRMLKVRARAFALRDAFADVLKGMHIREEVEDYATNGNGNGKVVEHDDGPPAPPPPPSTASPSTAPAEPDVIEGEVVTQDEIDRANAIGEAIEDDGPPDPNATANAAANAKLAAKIPTEDGPFLEWVKARLAECDADILPDTYTDSIEPHVPKHLAEDVMGLYRAREREIEHAPQPSEESNAVKLERQLLAEIEAQPSVICLIQWGAHNFAPRQSLPEAAQKRIDLAISRKTDALKQAARI